jgi:hypothetical protein
VATGFTNIPELENSWRPSVDTFADLPATNNNAGDARITSDTSTIYIWDGAAWNAFSAAGSIVIQDEGVPQGSVTTLNFVGSGVSATAGGGTATINVTGGGGGAPTTASYLTLGNDATLTNERVLTAGNGISFADSGANGTLTVNAAQMAANTIKGNNTGSTANALDLTQAQVTAMLDLFATSFKGLAPGPSGADVSNKIGLRADGVWSKEQYASIIRSLPAEVLQLLNPSGLAVELGAEGGSQPKLNVTSSPAPDPYTLVRSTIGALLLGLTSADEISVGGFLDTADLASAPTPYADYMAWFHLTADGFPRVKSTTIGTKKLWGNVKVLPVTISDLTTGLKLETLRIKTAIRILGWDIISNTTGSCVIDIVANSTLPTASDSIMGGSKPTLSAAQSNSATGLSIAVAANSYLRAEVESSSGLTSVTIMLHYREDE